MAVTLWGRLGRLWGGGVSESLYGQYHAVLGGVGLILQNGGYERRVAQTYASKLATGGLSQADQLQNQTVLLDDWSGGEGQLRQASSGGVYRRGSGIDVYSEPGAVGLGPQASLEWTSTANDAFYTVAAVQGNLFIGSGDGKIYRWISTSTAAPTLGLTSSKAGGITALTRYSPDQCFAGNGTDGTVYMWTGSSGWQTHFTISGTVSGCRAMSPHWKGTTQALYLAADRTGNRASIHYSADGSSATPTAAFTVDEPRIDVMARKRTNLVVVGTDHTHRRSSIYTIDDSTALNDGFEHKLSVDGIVLQCSAVVGDDMYLGDKYGGRIWVWDGTDLTLVHQLGTESSPYTGEIRGMWPWRGALWVSILDEDGTIGLLRRDPETGGWSRPVTGLAGTTPEQIAQFQGELVAITSATAACRLYTINDAYAGSGSVESGLIDANLGGTGKQWLGVTVVHSSLAATQSVEVQYKADDEGSWTSLGTSDTDGATEKTFDFPSPITAQTIAFKVVLTGTAGSTTPLKVYSLAARWLPSPGVKREWSLRVRLEGAGTRRMTGANGTALTETGEQISAGLWALVDAAEPVTYLDVDREEYTVRLVEYSEGLANLSNAGAMTNGWDLAGSLRIVEQ